MKNIILSTVLLAILSVSVKAETFKPESYTEVDKAKLKALPEEYKNKKIWYESTYFGYETTFPPYVEKSGFKAGKDFCLLVQPMVVPVMTEKTKELNDLIPTLKKGSKVKVYGKIKKFSNEPEMTMQPHYFLELEKIEVTGPPADDVAKDEKKDERKRDRRGDKENDENASPWRQIGPPQNPQKR